MRKFHQRVVEVLKQLADKLGEVNSTYDDVATTLGDGATSDDVHQTLIHLIDDGFFPGDPMLTSDQFVVRMPDGDEAFRSALIAVLRQREDKHGAVAGTYEEIATELGEGTTADDEQQGLINLNDDGYFEGTTALTSDYFECRLPDAE